MWGNSPWVRIPLPPRRVTARTLPSVDGGQLDELMGVALDEARAAAEHGDVPIGAVVARVETGDVLARRHNERERAVDPTAHAEILALRDAAHAVGSWRLDGCALVVTLEPCAMCAGAVVASRIDLVAFGAADPRLNHEATVLDGVRAAECAELLTKFFAQRR